MLCPACDSLNVSCREKYKPGGPNRATYGNANLDRRRYKCLDCYRTFNTIEIDEDSFRAGYSLPILPETKGRIR